MKKTISIFVIIMMMAIVTVSAYDVGQYINKEVQITGQWGWDADGEVWNPGTFLTGVYSMSTSSPLATIGFYVEDERLADYQYDLESHFGSNAETTMNTQLHVWTVNPPETTPGTAHTNFVYSETNFGEYSSSHIEFNGFGQFDYDSTTLAEGQATQDIEVDIN